MSRRPLTLYAAVLVGLLTGCSAFGSSKLPEGIDGTVSNGAGAAVLGGAAAPDSAEAALDAQVSAANARLVASLNQLRSSVAGLAGRDTFRLRLSTVQASRPR